MDIKDQGELLRTVANRNAPLGQDQLCEGSNNLGMVDPIDFYDVENPYLPLGEETINKSATGNRVIEVPPQDLH